MWLEKSDSCVFGVFLFCGLWLKERGFVWFFMFKMFFELLVFVYCGEVKLVLVG